MTDRILLVICGGSLGIVTAAGMAAFLIGLGLIPRYSSITGTKRYIVLYENTALAGTLAGTLATFDCNLLIKNSIFMSVFGLLAGIFFGGWIIAIGEKINVFPIVFQRINMKKGTGIIVVTIALAKVVGALLYFWKGW